MNLVTLFDLFQIEPPFCVFGYPGGSGIARTIAEQTSPIERTPAAASPTVERVYPDQSASIARVDTSH